MLVVVYHSVGSHINWPSSLLFFWGRRHFFFTFSPLLLFHFYLEDNCFTVLCWFLPNININQPSVQFSCSIVSNSLQPHGLQQARPPCPSPTPRTCSNSCPLSQWGHPTMLSFAIPFSSLLQSFPASGDFPVSQFFTSGGQSIGVSASASVLPMNIQD